MKRYGNLWKDIVDLENIKFAHKQARRGKSFYTEVKMVDGDIDKYCKEIWAMLVNKTFTTSPYEIEERHDGRKMRTIYKLPYYPDRIVQHALLSVVGPILVNSFIRDTFQSITGRGTADAAKRIKRLVRSKDCPRYALKIDVHKYYPSVNNNLMKQAIRKKIKCADTLWLFDDIIDSIEGLPIGNYTSQHLGNLYLNDFDWWIKQELKPKGYFRYCDDIVVFADTAKELVEIKELMVAELARIKLTIKPSWNIYDVHKNGIDFVGYVFKPSETRLRKSIAIKFKRACRRLKRFLHKVDPKPYLSTLMAYKGWAKPANAKLLWRKHTMYFRKFYPKQLRSAI
jgi:RNA-directed DNA polymerase